MASPAAIGSGRPAIEIGRNPRRGRYAVCFSSKIAGPQRRARGAKKTPRAFLFLRYVQGGGRSAEALRTTGQIQPVRRAGLAHRVRAKRGPMTGSGVTRLSVGDERRTTLRQSALRAGLGLAAARAKACAKSTAGALSGGECGHYFNQASWTRHVLRCRWPHERLTLCEPGDLYRV